MDIKNAKKLIGMLLVFVLTLLPFVGVYSFKEPDPKAPPARNGILDLSRWDFTRHGLVNLNGQWQFYGGQLLTPADFKNGADLSPTYVDVPGLWLGESRKEGLPRKGYGTYHLSVRLPEESRIYGVKVNSIRMSHRLYVNGKLEGESGNPSADAAGNRPGNTPYDTFFNVQDGKVDIIIQVSNFVYMSGGIVNAIQFGAQHDLSTYNSIQTGTRIAVILLLVMFGSYHLSIFILRRRERPYLYSALYLYSLMVVELFTSEKLALRAFPSLPFVWAYKSMDFSIFAGALLIMLFFLSLEKRILPKRKIVWMLAPIAALLLCIVLLPYSIYIYIKIPAFLYLALLNLFTLGRMLYLYISSAGSDRKELILFMGAMFSLGLYMVFGILYTENAVHSYLAGMIGIIGFITFINILLALRFTNAFEKMEQLSRQLALSNELKDEFLTHTSHELKTPVNGILNISADLLEDREMTLTPKQKQNLWLIKDTSVKLSMLINDVLDVTRLKHGELRLNPAVVELRMVAQIVLDVLQFELLGKNVQLRNDIEDDVWVLADENRLRQILYNLVQNSIKHTEKGIIRIDARQEAGAVQISVEDTGSGIPADRHESVFHTFDRLEAPSGFGHGGGMGLGLYISRHLAERMNGGIRVAWSEVNVGTCITFTLPGAAKVYAYRELAAASETGGRDGIKGISLERMEEHAFTILLVDDEASNMYMLIQLLMQQPYNILTAFSAEEALEKVKAHPDLDLVIMDVTMPRVSGIDLCRIFRKQYSILDLPILMATVNDSPQEMALGFSAGANDYIMKPFDAGTLMARIQTLLAMKTAIREAIRNELAFHQAQIKPHFLYNALSSVISFCYTDGEKAAHLLTMLSQYLRYILELDRTMLNVPLEHELDLIHAYVEIEKARFGERFEFICHVEENLLEYEIPSLCIQPFVENAIRHGLFEKESGGHVTLAIVEGDGYMQVTVDDNGGGIPGDVLYQIHHGARGDHGIGIANIRKRIDTVSGASLHIHSELGKGTSVTLYLPTDRARKLRVPGVDNHNAAR